MQIRDFVDWDLLNYDLLNMRCKHALYTSDKAAKVIQLSKMIGYDYALWGAHSGNIDIHYHADVIMKMEKDGYCHPERIVICNYSFLHKPCVWIDNLHSAVFYVRKFGRNVKLKDIPFYVVDITNGMIILSEKEPGIIDKDEGHLKGAVDCAFKRRERSYSKQLVDLNYTLGEFLSDNPLLLTCTDFFGTKGAERGAKR